jgi:hypothetical protein
MKDIEETKLHDLKSAAAPRTTGTTSIWAPSQTIPLRALVPRLVRNAKRAEEARKGIV